MKRILIVIVLLSAMKLQGQTTPHTIEMAGTKDALDAFIAAFEKNNELHWSTYIYWKFDKTLNDNPEASKDSTEAFIAEFDKYNKLVWATFLDGSPDEPMIENSKDSVSIYGAVSSSLNEVEIADSLIYLEPNSDNRIIDRTSINEISVYPIPTNTTLNIHLSSYTTNETLLITDILGEVIYKGTLSGIDNSIDVSMWSEGVYFYEVIGVNNIVRGKFVVQK
jgi:hypothetical protein